MLGYLLQVEDPIDITDKKEYNKKICKWLFKYLINSMFDKNAFSHPLIDMKFQILQNIRFVLGSSDEFCIYMDRYNRMEIGEFQLVQINKFKDYRKRIIEEAMSIYYCQKEGSIRNNEELERHVETLKRIFKTYETCFEIYKTKFKDHIPQLIVSLINELNEQYDKPGYSSIKLQFNPR